MPILYELKDHVARVTIDRPDVLNAIDAASERELQKIWSDIENNRDVRCVVLTGSGERAFSTGADMALHALKLACRERPQLARNTVVTSGKRLNDAAFDD